MQKTEAGTPPQRGNGHSEGQPLDGLCGQSERVVEDADRLLTHSGEALAALRGLARERLEKSLYTTLLVAGGVGYVLGGGLPLRFVTLAVGLGLRQAGAQALARLLADAQAGSRPIDHDEVKTHEDRER